MNDQTRIPDHWTFADENVADHFDEHVREQLPWYEMVTEAVAVIARHYIPVGGRVYDVGASTGNIGRAIAETVTHRQAELIAIEPEKEMARRYTGGGNLEIADATSYEFADFDLCICFLSLMFVPVAERAPLVRRLRERIRPGGALVVVDKVAQSAGTVGAILSRLTLNAKMRAGANSERILRKELSLAGAQIPIDPRLLSGGRMFFRFADFVGIIVESDPEAAAGVRS